MKTKFLACHFGKCPRIECQGHAVLPVGLYDELNMSRVKVYCPKCEDIFVPRGRRSSVSSLSGSQVDLDGSYFGPSFPHILLQNHPDLAPKQAPLEYIPTIFGFKVATKPGSRIKQLPEIEPELKKENETEVANSGEEKKLLAPKTSMLRKKRKKPTQKREIAIEKFEEEKKDVPEKPKNFSEESQEEVLQLHLLQPSQA